MATIIPFTFDEIYSDIVTKLGNDAVYEGSNLAQLVTAMSYLISSLNINTVANVNETFLPLARKPENVLETARLQSYEPYKKKSYTYTITLTLTSTISFSSPYIINKHDSFTIDGKTYFYMESTPLTIYGDINDTFTFVVKEGTLYSYATDSSLYQTIGTTIEKQTGNIISRGFIDIPYENIEENGIELFLTYTDSLGNIHTDEQWTKSETMLIDKDYSFNKKFIRKDDITFGTPRCYFKIAGIGNDLPSTTIVKSNVLQSKGSLGGITQNTDGTWPEAKFNGALDSVSISYSVLTSGADEENLESIRVNAGLFNNTANRVISPIDYISFCNSQAIIRGSRIWGGDEEYPVRPGQVWFSLLPSNYTRTFITSSDNRTYTLDNALTNTNWFVTDADVSNPSDPINPGLWDILEYYKVPTLRYHNRNPLFLDCNFGIKILKYNTLKSEQEINDQVFNVVDTYFKENGEFSLTGENVSFMEQFNVEFFITNLIKRINEEITDASGFSINMTNTFTIYDHNMAKETYDGDYTSGTLNDANIDISMSFGTPYEGILDADGYLITERLPNIDQDDITFDNGIISFNGNLYTDYTDVINVDYSNTSYFVAPIMFDVNSTLYEIGKYEIFNDYRKMIKITLFAQEDTSGHQSDPSGLYETSPLVRSMFDTPQTLNISFYSPNFKVLKNTIPRLNKVEFYA